MEIDYVWLPVALVSWGIMLLSAAGFWFFSRKKKNKDAVWWSLRGSILAFLFVMGFGILFEDSLISFMWIFGLVILALFIQITVSAIIHLMKHKEKVLPITILVIIPLFIIWSIIYNLSPMSNPEDDMCFEFCVEELGHGGFRWYWFDYSEYVCYCEDEYENVLRQKSFI